MTQDGAARSARAVAVEVVRRVIDENAYSNRVVPSMLRRSGLDSRDRRFAAELAYGTIRRRIPIDIIIQRATGRTLERITPGARHLLRVGVYQLVFGDVPPHAAVHETVSLASARERGFVNAVLRSIAAAPAGLPEGSTDDDISGRTGMSAWMIGELRRVIGGDPEAAAAAFASEGPLCIRANGCVTTVDALDAALREAGSSAARASLDPDCLLLDGGDPTSLPGWDDGWFAVQDQASAVVVRALDVRRGDTVLDACAAPGGKAAFAACLAGPGRVVASDVRLRRAALVAGAARRLHVRPLVVVHDAARPAVRGPFDRIVVDAPCSGLGSARRRPELLWRGRRSDLSRLARLQVKIVTAAAELLEPDGRLVYAVCTFTRAETDAACDAILRQRPELEPVPISVPGGSPTDRLRLWPHLHGSDGMFVAAFRRRH
jgi:16S rRNA (cytosine967-C5)-methyltransferase